MYDFEKLFCYCNNNKSIYIFIFLSFSKIKLFDLCLFISNYFIICLAFYCFCLLNILFFFYFFIFFKKIWDLVVESNHTWMLWTVHGLHIPSSRSEPWRGHWSFTTKGLNFDQTTTFISWDKQIFTMKLLFII